MERRDMRELLKEEYAKLTDKAQAYVRIVLPHVLTQVQIPVSGGQNNPEQSNVEEAMERLIVESKKLVAEVKIGDKSNVIGRLCEVGEDNGAEGVMAGCLLAIITGTAMRQREHPDKWR